MKRAATANRHISSRLVRSVLVALCAALSAAPATQALELQRGARDRDGKKLEPPKREVPAPRAGMSLDRIIEQVRERHKATVLRADEKRTKDGRRYYEIRLLSEEGRVWTIKVDAENGKTL